MTYDEAVETVRDALRRVVVKGPHGDAVGWDPDADALAALDTITAEVERLRADLAARDECETCGVVIGGEHDCATATPYIARLTAERDEAIAHAWDFENGNAYYRLQSRIATLERALRFYAEKENHLWQQKEHEDGERYTKASSLVDEDGGAIARAALTPDTPEDDR